jgi:hypothetical protein
MPAIGAGQICGNEQKQRCNGRGNRAENSGPEKAQQKFTFRGISAGQKQLFVNFARQNGVQPGPTV